MRKILSLGAACLAAGAFAFPYSTSFEAPTIVTGNLDGQDGWSNVLNSYQVVSGGARTGSQAASFVDNTGVAIPWAGRSGDAGANNAIGSVWVNVAGNSTFHYGFGLDVIYDGFSLDYSTIMVNRAGDVFATAGQQDPTLALVGNVGSIFDSYIEVTVTTNTVTKSVVASVNGSNFVLPTLTNSVSIRSIDMIALNMTSSTTGLSGQARFDDYSFAPVPEPATLLVLAGLASVAARRKRK